MGRNILDLTPELEEYILRHGTPPDEIQRDLKRETHSALESAAGMQIGADQSAFMTLLTKIVGVSNAVEVGTFTGMSSLAIARGMRPGGKLVCFDVSEEYTAIAKRYWERASLGDAIELRIGDAREGLKALPAEEYLDLVFVDADKTGYESYWAELVPRVRSGGVLLIDNTLWSGRVVEENPDEESTRAIKAFNELAAGDDRVEVVILPIGDGVTVARKR